MASALASGRTSGEVAHLIATKPTTHGTVGRREGAEGGNRTPDPARMKRLLSPTELLRLLGVEVDHSPLGAAASSGEGADILSITTCHSCGQLSYLHTYAHYHRPSRRWGTEPAGWPVGASFGSAGGVGSLALVGRV